MNFSDTMEVSAVNDDSIKDLRSQLMANGLVNFHAQGPPLRYRPNALNVGTDDTSNTTDIDDTDVTVTPTSTPTLTRRMSAYLNRAQNLNHGNEEHYDHYNTVTAGGTISPSARPLLPNGYESSYDTTPNLSNLPSYANLLTLEERRKKREYYDDPAGKQRHSSFSQAKEAAMAARATAGRLSRQLSECVALPIINIPGATSASGGGGTGATPADVTGRPLTKDRIKETAKHFLKLPAVLTLLYFFVCSLDFLSTSFRLIAGRTAGSVFQDSEIMQNPIVGLMIGVLFTVLVQSSSTCTSVIVSMVASGILQVKTAIPMIMGANIGTSLTSTLVSLTQAGDPNQYERAFSGATVHDCFNWLSVIALLSLEISTGYLYHLTLWLTDNSDTTRNSEHGEEFQSSTNMTQSIDDEIKVASSKSSSSKVNLLGAITKPFTKSIVQVDKKILECWGLGKCQDERLLKVWCKKPQNTTEGLLIPGEECSFLFNHFNSWSDLTLGIILLLISLTVLTSCLIFIVKILHSLLHGAVADLIRKFINADVPYVPWLTGYLAILVGAVLTFVVQSSSVFTSTLTPLVGVGLITVERVYPLTLGSNIGTTTTAVLASFAADQANFRASIQIALCHLFFNLTGILLFYPLPFMRWPLVLCKILGRTTARYRWFAVFYLLFMFFMLPGTILGLSMAGELVFICVSGPLLFLLFFVVIVNVMQVKYRHCLPKILRNWNFLPIYLRSLDPYDNLLRKINCCCREGYGNPEGNYSSLSRRDEEYRRKKQQDDDNIGLQMNAETMLA